MKILGLLLALAAAGASAPRAAAAQQPASGLNAVALAGQQVAVLPITMVVLAPELAGDSAAAGWGTRAVAVRRADSIVAEALQGRAPEVQWVLPPQLRKLARRAPGMMPDPDQMGQAALRAPKLENVPDPLRASMRRLVALTEGRRVLVPAALSFVRDTAATATAAAGAVEGGASGRTPIHATLTLVLADARRGSILWRSLAQGSGRTADEALAAALAAALPLETMP